MSHLPLLPGLLWDDPLNIGKRAQMTAWLLSTGGGALLVDISLCHINTRPWNSKITLKFHSLVPRICVLYSIFWLLSFVVSTPIPSLLLCLLANHFGLCESSSGDYIPLLKWWRENPLSRVEMGIRLQILDNAWWDGSTPARHRWKLSNKSTNGCVALTLFSTLDDIHEPIDSIEEAGAQDRLYHPSISCCLLPILLHWQDNTKLRRHLQYPKRSHPSRDAVKLALQLVVFRLPGMCWLRIWYALLLLPLRIGLWYTATALASHSEICLVMELATSVVLCQAGNTRSSIISATCCCWGIIPTTLKFREGLFILIRAQPSNPRIKRNTWKLENGRYNVK